MHNFRWNNVQCRQSGLGCLYLSEFTTSIPILMQIICMFSHKTPPLFDIFVPHKNFATMLTNWLVTIDLVGYQINNMIILWCESHVRSSVEGFKYKVCIEPNSHIFFSSSSLLVRGFHHKWCLKVDQVVETHLKFKVDARCLVSLNHWIDLLRSSFTCCTNQVFKP